MGPAIPSFTCAIAALDRLSSVASAMPDNQTFFIVISLGWQRIGRRAHVVAGWPVSSVP
jgi:hypothetical protein